MIKKPQIVCDATLIGKWEEITGQPASSITHNETDTEVLDGLVVYGYETKFGSTNENGEQYSKTAIDKFIQDYFIEKKLNMPVDVEHDPRPEWLVGRVIYAESNNTGFYFVVYIPRSEEKYNTIKTKIENGLIQGLSKMGCPDWNTMQWIEDKKEVYGGHWLINDIRIFRMSLVATPANGVTFERVKEVKNAMTFVSNHAEEKTSKTPKIFRKVNG